VAQLVVVGNDTRLRKALVALTDIPGHTTPLYLGARYEGKDIQLSGYVKGTSHADAKAFLASLEADFKAQEQWTVAGFTGYVDSFAYSEVPNAKGHRVSITLRRFD
jgi:hypothetical protein